MPLPQYYPVKFIRQVPARHRRRLPLPAIAQKPSDDNPMLLFLAFGEGGVFQGILPI
ncbi:MAG: hypothetical protein HY735_15025 [Verrucomicrobia bacterium]|nr:hypothetical protein [Verrucomicrobiota bacterium]